jgi:hypothetical protein
MKYTMEKYMEQPIEETKEKIKPKEKPHYVNNRDFSNAVVDHVTKYNAAKAEGKEGKELPQVPDYIASCFLKICEGLSHRSNFVRYTFREELVMDGVENLLKAILNYNIESATRTGKPNAFGYFTQIAWFAFLRRIAKEKGEAEMKLNYIANSGLEIFLTQENEMGGGVVSMDQANQAFVGVLMVRIDKVKAVDGQFKEYVKENKKRKQRSVKVDSDLTDFLVD